jgi:HEPN domain-containing protein
MPRKTPNIQSYSSIDDIRDVLPKVEQYAKAYFGADPAQITKYLDRCRAKARIWVDNQLERAKLQTFAKDNDKVLIEANYAVYLILKGTVRGEAGEQNNWIMGFKDDAKELIADIKTYDTAKKDLSSTATRFTKKRFMHQDYQAPDQVKRVPK